MRLKSFRKLENVQLHFLYIYISAVKLLIVINRIQNKRFCLCNIQYVCVPCIFIMYIHSWNRYYIH